MNTRFSEMRCWAKCHSAVFVVFNAISLKTKSLEIYTHLQKQ